MKINFPLLALAIGAFGIGTTEFSPMGLLPVIAKGVDVSIPVAGMLISAYAIGVMVGAPLMTLLLSHRARRNALIFLMGIFTVGNLLSSIAPDYTTLLLSRIITSLNHGAFFGLGSVVAASRNDPLAQFARIEGLAADWGASLVDLGEVGHLNPAGGYGPWDGVHQLLQQLV